MTPGLTALCGPVGGDAGQALSRVLGLDASHWRRERARWAQREATRQWEAWLDAHPHATREEAEAEVARLEAWGLAYVRGES